MLRYVLLSFLGLCLVAVGTINCGPGAIPPEGPLSSNKLQHQHKKLVDEDECDGDCDEGGGDDGGDTGGDTGSGGGDTLPPESCTFTCYSWNCYMYFACQGGAACCADAASQCTYSCVR